MSLATILLVEDESAIAEAVLYALRTEDFATCWSETGEGALILFREEYPDLVILDIGLPDVSGIDVLREIRKLAEVPVIFLTARASEIDRVVGLELGADDYVVKPFSPRELTARVKAVLRRTGATKSDSQSDEDGLRTPFIVDEECMQIAYHAEPLTLTRYEYRLLRLLIDRPGRVYSRDQLLTLAWNEPDSAMDRTVDTHIKTIRAKLKSIRADADPIKTHRGIGYSLSIEK